MTAFEDLLVSRGVGEYAAFLLPHLRDGMTLLDCGCGPASITYGLAQRLTEGAVIGLDFAEDSQEARDYARQTGVRNLTFVRGDINALPFPEGTFDAVLAHSLIEILREPAVALAEVRRVLKPGGVVGFAAVGYGGLIVEGPSAETLQQFYRLKEQYWERCLNAEPRRGRHLRSFLIDAGFRDVEASARYVSYGTGGRVRQFGEDRAAESEDRAFRECVIGLGLADEAALRAMASAWRGWGASSAAFLAFPWCSAVGWK